MLAQFIRAQLTLAAFSFVAYLAFLGPMRVQYALVLASAGGTMEFIPVVGPLVAAVVILGVALLTGYQHWLWLLIFLGLWRIIQDYVASPRIMGRSTELHPLAAIFGVLAGAEIAGVLGVYLSIPPIMASLRIVWRRWRLYAEKKRFGPLNNLLWHGNQPSAVTFARFYRCCRILNTIYADENPNRNPGRYRCCRAALCAVAGESSLVRGGVAGCLQSSEGKLYGEAARWRLKTPLPLRRSPRMRVSSATPEGAPKVIFAALDTAIALEMEPKFAKAGHAVISEFERLADA